MSLGVFFQILKYAFQETELSSLQATKLQAQRPLLSAEDRRLQEAVQTVAQGPSGAPQTMDSSGMLRGLLFVGLLSILCHGQASQEVSAEDFGVEKPEPAADRDLIEALEALLGRMHNRISSTEKRGSIPLCGMGDRCAMKFGPRIGKLCDCGRGANCNSYLLKCI
ncbi:cocaine- and amphetamine-regulated transcript protein-like isoform X1 [Lates japonicus]|uniref:Cocaine- and amphetamine-regulated transcript protein-like isoform X1 n=1 Tax=Lates japonicus TaxID=270547 RepID=A0AAD3MKC6_LATJO|nr:cocaine- and amphetamine-regulated transcript protein-like isoform X1 [Lates japonicus]